jgi:hypothetical protein
VNLHKTPAPLWKPPPATHSSPFHSPKLTQPLPLKTDANPLPELVEATVDRQQRRRFAIDRSPLSLLLLCILGTPQQHLDLTLPCVFIGEAKEDDAITVDTWTPAELASQP